MKRHTLKIMLLAAFGAATAAHSAFTLGDVNAGGIGYYGYADLAAGQSTTFSTHTGAWSWEDQGIAPGGGEGWTHTSVWVALNLTQAADVTISMIRDAAVVFAGSGNVGGFAATDNMFPSFTIWQNWDNDAMTAGAATALGYNPLAPPDDHHTYANSGNVLWAEDLTYLSHVANNTNPSAAATYSLAAGNYTIVFGSESQSLTNPPRQGFAATITAAPEPSRALLFGLGLAGFIGRRRR